jgi:hypothetical protein
MSYYRNGVKRDGESENGHTLYVIQHSSLQRRIFNLDQNVLEKSLAAHIHRIVNCFVTTVLTIVRSFQGDGRCS